MSPDRRALLEALGTVLRTHRFDAVMTAEGLRVTNPQAAGCCQRHPSALVVVRPREDDGARLWFSTAFALPLAEADRVIDALTAVGILLNGAPGLPA